MNIIVITDSGCEEACAIEIARVLPDVSLPDGKDGEKDDHDGSRPSPSPPSRLRRSEPMPKIGNNMVEVDGTLEDAALLGFRLQTARRVIVELTPPIGCRTWLEDLSKSPPDDAVVSAIIAPNMTFKVEAEALLLGTRDASPARDGGEDGAKASSCVILPSSPLPSPQEMVEEIAGWAIRHLKLGVDLRSPDIIIYAVRDMERLRIGVDVIGTPLAKRDWRIMLSRRSLKATVAAATAIYAGIGESDRDEVILDPLADDGTLAIESALLLTRTSPRAHARDFAFQRFPILARTDWERWKKDQDRIALAGLPSGRKIEAYAASLRDMKAIRTNSKLAGIDGAIHATHIDIGWLDLKLEEGSCDRILTSPIPSGKSISERQARKHADDLFNQAEFVLKKGKTLACITEKPGELLEPAAKHGFELERERKVLMGKRRMTVIVFRNTKKKPEGKG